MDTRLELYKKWQFQSLLSEVLLSSCLQATWLHQLCDGI